MDLNSQVCLPKEEGYEEKPPRHRKEQQQAGGGRAKTLHVVTYISTGGFYFWAVTLAIKRPVATYLTTKYLGEKFLFFSRVEHSTVFKELPPVDTVFLDLDNQHMEQQPEQIF